MLRPLIDFARDVRALGPSSALQGLKSRSGRGRLPLMIPGIGSVVVRQSDSDYDTLRQVFVLKHYEIGKGAVQDTIEGRYRDILANGKTPVIVDAGANVGLAALWFSRIYPKATIICIEPDVANFEILSQNVRSTSAIQPRHAAIGSTPGAVNISNETGLSWASETKRSDTGSVPIVTINDIIFAVPNGVPLIAKIDIEGFEEDLFSANLEWMNDVCAVFVEPHDWMHPHGRTSRSFQKAFGERSFGLFLRGENVVYVNDRFL